MRRMITTLIAGVATLATTGIADAAGPTISEFDDVGSGIEPDACGDGVDLMFEYDVHSDVKVFLNEAGVVTRYVQRDHGDTTWTRSDTGKTLTDPVRVIYTLDYDDSGELITATVAGAWWNIVYPGEGAIFQVVGRTVRISLDSGDAPVFLAGPKAFLEGQDFNETICEALA